MCWIADGAMSSRNCIRNAAHSLSIVKLSCSNCNTVKSLCFNFKLQRCCWLCQVELMLKLGTDLLSDLHQYKTFQKDAADLLDELRSWQSETFADWSRDILSQIDDPNTPLRYVLLMLIIKYCRSLTILTPL